MRRWLVLVLLIATPVFAVQPDEILDDPALEARAREISQGLRCLVCRNENIDESNAELARDLRILVRERLVAGDNDTEVLDFVVSRYGEYILLTPRADGANLILWLAGPVLLIGAGTIAGLFLRRRRGGEAEQALTVEENQRLVQLLDE